MQSTPKLKDVRHQASCDAKAHMVFSRCEEMWLSSDSNCEHKLQQLVLEMMVEGEIHEAWQRHVPQWFSLLVQPHRSVVDAHGLCVGE